MIALISLLVVMAVSLTVVTSRSRLIFPGCLQLPMPASLEWKDETLFAWGGLRECPWTPYQQTRPGFLRRSCMVESNDDKFTRQLSEVLEHIESAK